MKKCAPARNAGACTSSGSDKARGDSRGAPLVTAATSVTPSRSKPQEKMARAAIRSIWGQEWARLPFTAGNKYCHNGGMAFVVWSARPLRPWKARRPPPELTEAGAGVRDRAKNAAPGRGQ